MIKNFFLKTIAIFFITLIFFILLNVLISYSWRFYNNYKYSNHSPLINLKEAYDLNEKDLTTLYKETVNLRFRYVPYIGAVPKEYNSKFVNFDNSFGRIINNNKDCGKKIYFFGGSTTFGWFNEDYNTIPALFKIISDVNLDNYCVFNFGSPFFFSKQENIYLLNLIENKQKPDYAIFIDGVNEICHEYIYSKNFKDSFAEINAEHRTLIFNKKLPALFKSIPAYQLADKLSGNNVNFNNFEFDLDSNCNTKKNSITDLFDLRVKLRANLCNSYGIVCLTFLQPFGGVHGNIHTSSTENFSAIMLKKYNLLKKIFKSREFLESEYSNKYKIFDIANSFKKDKKIYYVDNVHYSSYGNNLIANEIYKIFVKNR